jgi:phage/plasmid-associated DNA primase
MFIEFAEGRKFPDKDGRTSDSLDMFKDAGYLLQDNEVVVDIDITERVNNGLSKQVLRALFDTWNIKTKTVETDRGFHLYFKRPHNLNGASGTGELSGIPIELEYKHTRNTKAITVKRFGFARPVSNENILQDFPEVLWDPSAFFELQPMKPIKPFTGTFDFPKFQQCLEILNDQGFFDEGGNYQNWASFVNAMARAEVEGRYSHEEGLDLCRIIDINGATFDKYERALLEPVIEFGYIVNVMKANGIMAIKEVCETPLDRFCWWTESDKGTMKFHHYMMARYIRQNFSLVRHGDENGELYYYSADDGYYKRDSNWKLLNGTIRSIDETLTISQVREVATGIYESASIIKEWDRTHIPVKNGLWDIEKKMLVPFGQDIYVDYKIDVNWNPEAHSTFIDETLDKMSNYHVPTRANLEEALGSIVSPELLTRFVWFLFGRTAHNGKSFFLTLIKQLIEEKSFATLSPHDVAKSQFKVAELYGKRVNMVDETGEVPIPAFDRIKILITGGFITIEFKGKNAFTVKLEVPQVWCSNFFPNIREEGNQVNRRLEIIPMDYNFEKDPNVLADSVAERMAGTPEAREYILKIALEGMYRLIENNGQPTPNEKRNQQKEEFIQNNDRLGEFLETINLLGKEGCYADIELMAAGEIYKKYVQWCLDNDEKFPYGKMRFKNEMMKRFNLKHVKKKLIDPATGKAINNPTWGYIIND